MSGHVVYACSCLNIKIHLASKYSLVNHTSERQQYWFEQENPAMEGWHLNLGMGAVVVAYSSLIETRTNSTHSWMTVGCLNCDTKNVYSIHNKASNRSSSGQSDEFVVIHKDTIFGSQLDDVRNDDQFSDIFDIKLSNSANSISLTHPNEVPDKLRAQHQELYQVLEKALDKMRLASEVRIEQWKKVEMERLEDGSQRAREESKKLWRKVLSVNQPPVTPQSNDKDTISTTPKSTTTTPPPPPATDELPHDTQPTMNATITSAPLDTNTPSVPSSSSLSKAGSQQESKRSQAVRFMDHTNDHETTTLLSSYRRSSFNLNHSAIVNSSQQNDSPADHRLTHLTNVPNNQVQKKDASSDEEDMFDLDEELDSNDDDDDNRMDNGKQQQGSSAKDELNGTDDKESTSVDESSQVSGSSIKVKTKNMSNNGGGAGSVYGSSWIKRKKLTGKYIDDFGNGSRLDEEQKDGADGLEDLSTSISKFATSMPINIQSAMANLVPPKDDDVDKDPTTNDDDNNNNDSLRPPSPSRPSTITTSFSFAPKKTTSSSTSFVGYDFSFSDRALSKQFPDYNPGRRKSVATVSSRQQPQLDALIEKSSLDTRTMKK